MRRKTTWSTLLIVLVCGCGRNFAPPPPEPVIASVEPATGFLDDPVVITGQNLGQTAADALVTFGNQSAEVQSLDEDSGVQRLTVKVPALTSGETVSVKVIISGGQGVAENAFQYLGPGHPLRQEVAGERMARAFPVAVFSLPGFDSPIYGVVNRDARDFLLVFQDNGIQLHGGLCGEPMSGASALLPSTTGFGVQIWNAVVDLGQALKPHVDLVRQELRLSADLKTVESLPPEKFALPKPGDREAWPVLVEAFCPQFVCRSHSLAVSDALSPALYLISPQPVSGQTPAPKVVLLDSGAKACNVSDGYRVGIVQQDPLSLDLFALANSGREVWTLTVTGNNPHLAFAVDDLSGNQGTKCQARASSLVVGRSRVQLTDPQKVFLVQTAPLPALVQVENRLLTWTEQARVLLNGIPYAAASGLVPDPAGGNPQERLMVATTFGLQVFDVSGTAPVEVYSKASSATLIGPQALVVNDAFQRGANPAKPDRFLLLDQNGDWLHTFVAGQEAETETRLPVGTLLPVLARGDASGVLFLGDALSDVIRMIDRESGVLLQQFGVHGGDEFGMTTMLSIPVQNGAADLLVAPAVNTDTTRPAPFNGVVVRAIGPASPAPDCWKSLTETPATLAAVDDYHWMAYLPRPTPRLFFVRNANPGATPPVAGRVWALPVDLNATTAEAVLAQQNPVLDLPLPDQAIKVGTDQAGTVLGVVVRDKSTAGLVVREMDSGHEFQTTLDTVVASQVDSLALVRPKGDGAPEVLVLLSGPIIGVVLALAFDSAGQVTSAIVPTGGTPEFMAISPDSRRAYAVHTSMGQISVIDLDCQPLPSCLRVETNLRVADLPQTVQFSPDGAEALVLHLYNGGISVIQ